MSTNTAHETASDAIDQRLRASVGQRPQVSEEEHRSVMSAVRAAGTAPAVKYRPVELSPSLHTRFKIAAGLALCGLLVALIAVLKPSSELAAMAPVGETLSVVEALPRYAQTAALQLEAIPNGEWSRIQEDGQAVYGHVLRCITQFGG